MISDESRDRVVIENSEGVLEGSDKRRQLFELNRVIKEQEKRFVELNKKEADNDSPCFEKKKI